MRILLILTMSGFAVAQTIPTVYTLKEHQTFGGPPGQTVTIYRNGSKAAIDIESPSGSLTRSVKDLDAQSQHDWDGKNPSGGCSIGKWKGDWGDPFIQSKSFESELDAQHPKVVGAANVLGMPVKVLQASMPDGASAKMWVNDKLGLMLRADVTTKTGETQTLLEIKQLSFDKPPDSIFTLPPSCVAADHPYVDPNFADATKGPASTEHCTILLRVVKADGMEPIIGGFRMGIDVAINPAHPQQHTVGQGPDGLGVFGGGGIHDVTSRFQDGVLRLGPIGPMFDIEAVFDNNRGFASGMMYKQCFGPTTMLLMVVKDPNTIGKGVDYLWDKTGKYLPKPK